MNALALVSMLAAPVVAHADIPGPNDELCTVDKQEQDGSSCQSCGFAGYDPEGTRGPCLALEEQGLIQRCAIGATAVTVIYCDREADWVAVGRGDAPAEAEATTTDSSTCGCRAPGGRPGALGGLVLSMGALAMVGYRVSRRRG